MGDTTFPARYTTTLNTLNNTATNLFQQYITVQNSSSSIGNQSRGLTAELIGLKSKLAAIQKEGETYDREFLDRSAGKNNNNVFRRNGISTLQDWLLFIFFVAYAVIAVSMIAFVASSAINKLYVAAMGLAIALIFGVMMSGVITRFI
jgi:hypothetical protein